MWVLILRFIHPNTIVSYIALVLNCYHSELKIKPLSQSTNSSFFLSAHTYYIRIHTARTTLTKPYAYTHTHLESLHDCPPWHTPHAYIPRYNTARKYPCISGLTIMPVYAPVQRYNRVYAARLAKESTFHKNQSGFTSQSSLFDGCLSSFL